MDNSRTGRFIAEARKQKGFTQQQLADKLNLSNKTISKWESGAGSPDISNLEALADILGLTVDELLKGECKVTESVSDVSQSTVQDTDSQFVKSSDTRPDSFHMSNTQKWGIALVLLSAGIGAILGIMAYNFEWLG